MPCPATMTLTSSRSIPDIEMVSLLAFNLAGADTPHNPDPDAMS